VEREEISRGIAEELSARQIAARLGRDPSVISREIARDGGRSGYRAHRAAERAQQATRRPKRRKLEADRRLHDAVAAGLAADWSPERIAGRLRVDHPDG
jgi:transposase, IS30 family